jgi:glycosyltransferase involved in cell wall biosynthesis
MLTICIPARHEIYLDRCVDDIYKHATGEIEVIVVYDDYWPSPILGDRPGLIQIHHGKRRGMRAAINAAAEIGRGDYLMKVDAHCAFPEGFDEMLTAECDGDWLVTPRRYSLVSDTWSIKLDKPAVFYEYLSYPYENGEMVGLHARYWWKERDRARKAYDIDENMSFQGSCWLMPMAYFRRLIYPMDIEHYGLFVGEPQEIGLKVWLSGGRCMLNKKVWYSHLWKGQPYRDLYRQMYGKQYSRVGHTDFVMGNKYSTEFWFNNYPFPGRVHDLAWLVDRFAPVPTWPEDRSKWTPSHIS